MASDGVTRMNAAAVFSEIRQEIEGGSLRTRDRLPPERDLAGRYSVSRGTIRRALSELAAQGLVEIRPGSGAYVSGRVTEGGNPVFDDARPLELMDVRFALEPHICRLAVLNATRPDIDDLYRFLARMEECRDMSDEFARHDAGFHARLVDITGNPLLSWISAQINSVRGRPEWTRMRILTLEPAIIAAYNRQHRRIVDAIAAREPETAARWMKEHLETARLSLTRASAT